MLCLCFLLQENEKGCFLNTLSHYESEIAWGSSVGYLRQEEGEERCTMGGFTYSTLHYGAPVGQVG